MNDSTVNRQCSATKSGTDQRCGAYAIKGGTVCVYHGGKAPQVREAANRRLLEMADPALRALSDLVHGSEQDSVKLQAAKDILDRVGLGATHKVEADVTHHNDSDIDREIDKLLGQMTEAEQSTSPTSAPQQSTDFAGSSKQDQTS